jgi:hypothetical protein
LIVFIQISDLAGVEEKFKKIGARKGRKKKEKDEKKTNITPEAWKY